MNDVQGQPRIVVGVDLSAASIAALHWAAREAGLRWARLEVVRACERSGRRQAPYGHLRAAAQDPAVAAGELADAVTAVTGHAPAITITIELAEGLAARVLLDRATGAELLVLGGAAGGAPPEIGPVARACLSHPPCPVVVVSTADTAIPASA